MASGAALNGTRTTLSENKATSTIGLVATRSGKSVGDEEHGGFNSLESAERIRRQRLKFGRVG